MGIRLFGIDCTEGLDEILQCPAFIRDARGSETIKDWFEESTVELDKAHSKSLLSCGLQAILKYAVRIYLNVSE